LKKYNLVYAKKRLKKHNNHHQHKIYNLPKKLPNLQQSFSSSKGFENIFKPSHTTKTKKSSLDIKIASKV